MSFLAGFHFIKLHICLLSLIAGILMFAPSCTASDYLWLRPEKQTTLPSGNASGEFTLMQNDKPLKLSEKNLLTASYRCRSLKGSQKEYTMPLIVKQYPDMTTFTAESSFVALCDIWVIVKNTDTIYSLQCSTPLFGNGYETSSLAPIPLPSVEQFPKLQLIKNNLPYYFPVTGEKLTFIYTTPFAQQNNPAPFLILPDNTIKEITVADGSSFSYTQPAAPPFALVADTSIKRLIVVQPDIAPDGQKYCTALTLCLAEPYTRYLAIKEGWLLFAVSIVVIAFAAYKITRRPFRHANK